MTKAPLQLTRLEIEARLTKGLVGKHVSFTQIDDTIITGKVHRLAVEPDRDGELMVMFSVDKEWLKADLRYFADFITIHYGVSAGTNQRDVRGILKEP